jgi:4-diphosphocytidyl-2-C-methyl-D-erythritol kinase
VTALSVVVAIDAPAKINLALHVVGRRSDGYHLLESLSVFAQFADRLSVESSGEDRFHVHGPKAAEVPAGEDNLVLRARDALRRRFPAAASPVSIALEKNLPAAAGLGGGSSDAAAAMLALARLWRLPAGMNELQDIGLALGADLPMCIERRPLVARGVGEQLQPLPQFPALPMVLANPGVGVSTPAVFGALARRDNPPLPEVPRFADSAAVAAWLAGTRNDLTEPALAYAPPIADALDALDRQGAMLARMSGSGATCFGLFREMADAEQAATQLGAERPDWFVVATIAQGTQD